MIGDMGWGMRALLLPSVLAVFGAFAACRQATRQVFLEITVDDQAARPEYLLLDWSAGGRTLFANRRVPDEGILHGESGVVATVSIEVPDRRDEARTLAVRGMRGGEVVAAVQMEVPPSTSEVQRVTVVLARQTPPGPDGGAPPDGSTPVPDAQGQPDAAAGAAEAAADRPPPDAQGPPDTVDVRPPACAPGSCKRVFITSRGTPSGSFGGLAGGDALCQGAAEMHGLDGTWRAWLSDTQQSPATRFAAATVPYRLLDGTLVANDFADLIDGSLARPINVYDTGARIQQGIRHEVWTGTAPSGNLTSTHCTSWTNGSAGGTGTVGASDEMGSSWSSMNRQFCDRADLRLYCFEQ